MRRRLPSGGGVPATLVRFELAEWPGRPSAAFDAWCEARRAWLTEGNVWPGGDVAMCQQELAVAISLPDEEWAW